MRRSQGPATNVHPLLIDATLIAFTLIVFAQTLSFDFAKVDDTFYVTSNAHVLGGLRAGSVAWAMRSFEASNWHPLTWISLMIDAGIGSGRPRAFHATNLAFHCGNVLLLFHLLSWTTRSTMRSAFVAALFAIHPLHVESVAWVTERKDVLSTFFWLLALLAHVRYASRPSALRYAAVVAAFVLGALSKPMVITLPLTLLLFDFWPLARLSPRPSGAPRDWRPVVETLPLLAISTAIAAVTLVAQSSVTAPLATVPASVRGPQAIVAYATYAAKMIWPTGLSIHYVFLDPMPAWTIVVSACALSGMTWLAIAERKRRPYVTFGWLWYVTTLVPVIGFVPVGEQSIADRYTYVPLIGLFVIVAWGVPDLVSGLTPARLPKRRWLAGAAAVVLAALAARAHDQTSTWRNGFELFRHAVDVNGENALARMGYGQELAARGRDPEAIVQYREALRLRPEALFARRHLAECLERTGQYTEAAGEFRELLRADSANAEAALGLGVVLLEAGEPAEAAGVLERAATLQPENARIRATLGLALTQLKRYDEAEATLGEALRLDPVNVIAHKGIAVVLGATGRLDQAIAHLRKVLGSDPNQPDARENLVRLLLAQGQHVEAEAVRTGR
jgi:Flp pilus assembly protein TadD